MRISDSLAQSLLKQSDALSEAQLNELRVQLAATKKPLQDLIIQNGVLSEAELTGLYAEHVGVPFIELPVRGINHRVLSRLPEHVAARYKAVVFAVDDADGSILVAMEDPGNAGAVSFLEKQLGNNLRLHLTSASQLNAALDQYRNNQHHQLVNQPDDPDDPPTLDTSTTVAESAIVDSVHHILEQALGAGASDIHIEPHVNHLVIRYRIDGLLREVHKLPVSALHPLLGYIKTMSRLKLTEHHAPQYGQWGLSLGDEHYRVRVSILPTIDGEKAVLHIVHESGTAPTLRALGLWGSSLHDLQKAATEPHGAVLIVGPIGSGKSTTLFGLLSALSSPSVNIATIEDPVQYRIPGANQVELNSASGITLPKALQAVLSQDPNIIMISKLDDTEVCKAAIQASFSGHLVLGALHGASAAAGVRRLLAMNIEPFSITAGVRVVVGQRLARQLCASCREAITPDKASLDQLELAFPIKDYGGFRRLHELETVASQEGIGRQGSGPAATSSQDLSSTARGISRLWQAHDGGCVHCHYSGYQGRIGIFEVMMPSSPAVQKAINHDTALGTIHKAAVESGMISLQLDGLVKALRGLTTATEVLRVSRHG